MDENAAHPLRIGAYHLYSERTPAASDPPSLPLFVAFSPFGVFVSLRTGVAKKIVLGL